MNKKEIRKEVAEIINGYCPSLKDDRIVFYQKDMPGLIQALADYIVKIEKKAFCKGLGVDKKMKYLIGFDFQSKKKKPKKISTDEEIKIAGRLEANLKTLFAKKPKKTKLKRYIVIDEFRKNDTDIIKINCYFSNIH